MKLTRLGRPLEQDYTPNVAIIIVTIVCVASASLYKILTGENIPFALIFAFILGITVFLGWAVCREMDPDNDYSAFVHIPFTIGGMLAYGVPNVFLLLLILHLQRMLTRSSGYHATWFESFVWFAVGAVMIVIGDFIAGFVMAAAFILDGLMKEPLRRHIYFGAAAFVLSAVYFAERIMTKELILLNNVGMGEIITALIIVISYITVIIKSGVIKSKRDNGEGFDAGRIKAVQILVLSAVAAYILLEGVDGLKLTYPLWTVILGVVIYRFYKMIYK